MAVTLAGDTVRPRRSRVFCTADRAAAARRHLLYCMWRSHVAAGWNSLPDGLSAADIRDLAAMAGSRRDHVMLSLCRPRAPAPTAANDSAAEASSPDACAP